MATSSFTKCDISILVGNVLCHFDTAFYGFLAPLIAPLFFPGHDQIVQLILAYSFMATSLITRPLGAFIFGVIAKHLGPIQAISYSLAGVALLAISTGLIPTYDQVGIYAPFALLIIKSLKGIFIAGESAIVKLYIVENKKEKAAFRASYIYQGSSIIGAILASGISSAILWFDRPDLWRYCFISGGIVGFIAYRLRFMDNLPGKQYFLESYNISVLKSLWQHKASMLSIALTTGLSHITYILPCIVMNSLIPLIANVTIKEMMELNTALLIFDMVIIFVLGPLLSKFNYLIIIRSSALVLAITVPILLIFLPYSSLGYITFVRVWIVFWGVVFMCPQNLYYQKLFSNCQISLYRKEDNERQKHKTVIVRSHRRRGNLQENPGSPRAQSSLAMTIDAMPPPTAHYLFVGMANALGAGLIGHTFPALSMWLWYAGGNMWLLASYVGIIGIGTVVVVRNVEKASIL